MWIIFCCLLLGEWPTCESILSLVWTSMIYCVWINPVVTVRKDPLRLVFHSPPCARVSSLLARRCYCHCHHCCCLLPFLHKMQPSRYVLCLTCSKASMRHLSLQPRTSFVSPLSLSPPSLSPSLFLPLAVSAPLSSSLSLSLSPSLTPSLSPLLSLTLSLIVSPYVSISLSLSLPPPLSPSLSFSPPLSLSLCPLRMGRRRKGLRGVADIPASPTGASATATAGPTLTAVHPLTRYVVNMIKLLCNGYVSCI